VRKCQEIVSIGGPRVSYEHKHKELPKKPKNSHSIAVLGIDGPDDFIRFSKTNCGNCEKSAHFYRRIGTVVRTNGSEEKGLLCLSRNQTVVVGRCCLE
jgi:hypothetical protein